MASLTPAMLAGPAAAPPPGQTINFANPPSRGNILIVMSSVLLAVMLLSVFNRIYAKTVLSREFRREDGACVIATLFTLAYYITVVLSVTRCHVGVHQWNITLGEFLATRYIVDTYLAEILSAPSFLAIKMSFFLLYLRIFGPKRSLRIAIWVGGVITVLVYAGFTIAWLVLGTRRQGESWQEQLLGPEQAKGTKLSFPIPAFGLVTDVYIFIIPFIGIFGLQLPKRQKLGVALIFFTAILAVIASILRIVYTVAISQNTLGDLTYNIMPVYLTIMVEMTLGVTITCMPALSQTLRHTLPAFKGLQSRVASYFSKSSTSSQGRAGFSYSTKTGAPKTTRVNYEMNRYSAPKSYISTPQRDAQVEEDVVHLKYEIDEEAHQTTNN